MALPVPGGGHRHHRGRHPAAAPCAIGPEDDYVNPFLSPSYNPSSPLHCVVVQDAGVSHGVPTPLLYFRGGSPVLLSDDRYYDMCILRIDCPNSDGHIIWFLDLLLHAAERRRARRGDCRRGRQRRRRGRRGAVLESADAGLERAEAATGVGKFC